jgi:catechol 2,3-dioxygenase
MSIHKDVRIGHIHLTVGNLERSLAFYRDLLGFEVTTTYGPSAVFLSAGGYHHHIGLNTWAGEGAPPAVPGHAGIYHYAILFPTRKELALVLKRIVDAGYPLEGAADHAVSEAIYLRDPDNIGVELYIDRPKEEWKYDANGQIMMTTEPLNLDSLLALLEENHGTSV